MFEGPLIGVFQRDRIRSPLMSYFCTYYSNGYCLLLLVAPPRLLVKVLLLRATTNFGMGAREAGQASDREALWAEAGPAGTPIWAAGQGGALHARPRHKRKECVGDRTDTSDARRKRFSPLASTDPLAICKGFGEHPQ